MKALYTFTWDDFKSYDVSLLWFCLSLIADFLPQIWSTAASQIFFSLSVGYGGQLALSSYNKFRNNCHRDAFIVGICNSVTSVFAGLVVFAILGNLADGKDINTVVNVNSPPTPPSHCHNQSISCSNLSASPSLPTLRPPFPWTSPRSGPSSSSS